MVRLPLGPCASTSPSSASRQAGSSAAGSAKAIEPPSVPRVRIAGWAIKGMARAISGACWAMMSERSAWTWRTNAPISTAAVFVRNAVEPGNAVDVDQQGRRRQPHVERGDQALPTGEQAGVAMLAQQRNRFVERLRLFVCKRRWLHATLLPALFYRDVFLIVTANSLASMRQRLVAARSLRYCHV